MEIEITPDMQNYARSMGIPIEEFKDIVQDWMSTWMNNIGQRTVDEYTKAGEKLNDLAKTSDKTQRVVVLNHLPCYVPRYLGGPTGRRGRTRRKRIDIPTVERTHVSEGFPLSRDSQTRLEARIRDDARRIVSSTPIE